MNDQQKILARVLMYLAILLGPIAIGVIFYAFMRDIKRGLAPSLGSLILLETISIVMTIYAYWFIKRMDWDFWRKDKPQKNKLSSNEKWWEEKD